MYLVCLIQTHSREKIFREIHEFYSFYPRIFSPRGDGHEINNFLSPYPTDATYQIYQRLAQQFLRRRCSRTKDEVLSDTNPSIRHLSDSSDLKSLKTMKQIQFIQIYIHKLEIKVSTIQDTLQYSYCTRALCLVGSITSM